MGASVRPSRRFATLPRADQDRVRANLAKMNAQHASDAELDTYLSEVEGLEPDPAPAPAPAASTRPTGNAVAGMLSAPFESIPGVMLASQVGSGLVDAANDAIHGRPASITGSIEKFRQRDVKNREAATNVGHGIPAGILEGAGMAASAPLMGLGAAGDVAADAVKPATTLIQKVLASAAAKNAATGAAWAGATRGLAPTNESLMDRARAAADALPTGAAFGAAVPAAVEGVAKVGRYVGGSGEDRALALIQRVMRRTGVEPGAVAADAASAPAGEVLADRLGDSGRRLTRYAASVPSAGSEQLTQFLESRGLGRGERLTNATEEAMGVTRGNVVETQKALEAARKVAAKTNYDIARATPPVDDGDVLATIHNDEVLRDAFDRARRIMRRATKTDQPPLTRTTNVGGTEVTEYVPQPLATLDLMKRTIGDVIGTKQAGTSSVGHYEGSVSKGVLDDLLGQMDALRPEYKAARAQFSHDMKLEEALARGQEVFRPGTQPEQVAADFGQTIDDAKHFYRQGAARDLWGRTEGVDPLGNRSLAFHQKPTTGQKVETLAASPESAEQYRRRLISETLQRRTEAAGIGGSPTARIQQDIRDAEGPSMLDLAGAAAGGPTGLLKLGGRELLGRRMQLVNEQTGDALSRYLQTGKNGPQDYEELLAALRLFAAEPAQARVLRSRVLTRAVGTAAGSP